MSAPLTLAISPCPNDTFIFGGLVLGLVDAPFTVRTTFADVAELNEAAARGAYDVVKVSVAAYPDMERDYALLPCGGALGRGCGPLLVARPGWTMESLREAELLVPGFSTTANRLLDLHGGFKGPRRALRYDLLMDALASGEAQAGVIIHEGRFTYAARDLSLVLDLGEWWEGATGLPLPLGGIAVRRSLGQDTARTVARAIRASLLLARAGSEPVEQLIRERAQELDPGVIQAHIETFVNDFSLDLGEEGRTAIRRLLGRSADAAGLPLFTDD